MHYIPRHFIVSQLEVIHAVFVYCILLSLRLGWLLVVGSYLKKLFTNLKYESFLSQGYYKEREGWASVNRFNHTSWVAVLVDTPNDRPYSLSNHFVIEVFGGGFVLSLCFFNSLFVYYSFVTKTLFCNWTSFCNNY